MNNEILNYLRSVTSEQLLKDWAEANESSKKSISEWLKRLRKFSQCGEDAEEEFAHEVWSSANSYIADKIRDEHLKFDDNDMEFLAEIKREVKAELLGDFKLLKSYFPKLRKSDIKNFDLSLYEL